jgi:3-dehydroquinate synthase
MQSSTIYLYGPPGSGKSTTGRILAERLNLPFYDLDEEIQVRSGKTVARIFAQQGETAFRELERQEMEYLSSRGKSVVALGGGALLAPAARRLAEASGTIVYLQADQQEILRRLKTVPSPGVVQLERPLLKGDSPARLSELLRKRLGHYASFPLRLDTTGLNAEQATWQLQILLGQYLVGFGSSTQEILVRPGVLDDLGQALSERDIRPPVAVVTDTNIAPLYAARVLASLKRSGIRAQLSLVPFGEASKTIGNLQKLWECFLEAGLERGSTAIALGGGVVGDLAGFAAATYLRGIQWVSVPTSLLAMVDASLGGKTGVDTSHGKNLVGAFHPARLVLADVQLLASLPEVELRCGLAEMIKHAIIGDETLLSKSAGFYHSHHHQRTSSYRGQTGWGDQETSDLISRAMAVKIGIIEQDPYEKGIRAALNLGHTVGHALEVVSAYRLRHGEAVSIGMVVEARLAERLDLAETGLAQSIAKILADVGLPIAIPGDLDPAFIRQVIQVDKKKAHGKVRFTLPARIGQVLVGVEVPDEVLASEL